MSELEYNKLFCRSIVNFKRISVGCFFVFIEYSFAENHQSFHDIRIYLQQLLFSRFFFLFPGQSQAASTNSSSSSSQPIKNTTETSNSDEISLKLAKLNPASISNNSTTDTTSGNARVDKISTRSSEATLQPTLLDEMGTATTNMSSGRMNDASVKFVDTAATSKVQNVGDTTTTIHESMIEPVIMSKLNQANMLRNDNIGVDKLAPANDCADVNPLIMVDETNQKVSGCDLTTAMSTKNNPTNNSDPAKPKRQLSAEYTTMMNANNKAMAIVQPTETNNNLAQLSLIDGGGSNEKQRSDRDQISKLATTITCNGISNRTVMVQFKETLVGGETEEKREKGAISRDKVNRKETISMIMNGTDIGDNNNSNNNNLSSNNLQTKEESNDDEIHDISERVYMVERALYNTNEQTTNVDRDKVKEHTIEFYGAHNLLTNNKSQPDGGGKMVKVNSVDSIELPAALVDSIRSLDPNNDDNSDERPTPNPLIEIARASQSSSGKQSSSSSHHNNNQESFGVEKKSAQQDDTDNNKDKNKNKNRQQPMEKQTKMPSTNTKVSILKRRDSGMEEAMLTGDDDRDISLKQQQQQQQTATNEWATVNNGVGHHPTVVNKLNVRKTDLEIVDVRDKSVVGNIKSTNDKIGGVADKKADNYDNEDIADDWITMEGVAVVGERQQQHQQQLSSGQGAISGLLNLINHGAHQTNTNQHANTDSGTLQQQQQQQHNQHQQMMVISPSEIIESRFKIDYGGQHDQSGSDIDDEKSSAIETEIELDRAMKNRKYFIYIVHDGHFNAKKECIARIELPQKRRITLAELRQVIATSTDVSLSSLRKNRFKFVTETYRLLSENEDNAVLHQVYPTQGVFLKLNIPDQDQTIYPYKDRRPRRMSQSTLGSGAGGVSTLSQGTVASRGRLRDAASDTPRYGAIRAHTGPTPTANTNRLMVGGEKNTNTVSSRYRSRSSGATLPNRTGIGRTNRLAPSISVNGSIRGSISDNNLNGKKVNTSDRQETQRTKLAPNRQISGVKKTKRTAPASESVKMGVISGAKRLFNATFKKG